MAEREGFEPSVPLLTVHAISSRAPSANSDISPHKISRGANFGNQCGPNIKQILGFCNPGGEALIGLQPDAAAI